MTDPGTARTPLRTSLLLLAGAGTALGALLVAGLLDQPVVPGLLATYAACGLAMVLGGAWATWRRPLDGTGTLLCLTGGSVLLAAAGNLELGVPRLLGSLAAEWPLAFLVHLLVAFPGGRVRGVGPRALVAGAHLGALVPQVPQVLYGADVGLPSWARLGPSPDLVARWDLVQTVVVDAVIVLAAVVLVMRLITAGRGRRGRLAALYGYGALALAGFVATARVAHLLDLGVIGLFRLQLVLLAGVPVAFVLAVLTGGFVRAGSLDELAARLGAAAAPGPDDLDSAVAAALGDPTARVLTGATGPDERPPPGRVWVAVGPPEAPVGRLEHDVRQVADPRPVAAVAQVVSLAARATQLSHELGERAAELRRSRARLVTATDDERRRTARDLHDGVQGRLVVLALEAGRLAAATPDPEAAASAAALRDALQACAEELRRLTQGLLPAPLVERGLSSAVAELVDGVPAPVRLTVPDDEPRADRAVESAAYFVVAEALANVVKHASARQVDVRVEVGGGRLVVEVADDGAGGAWTRAGGGLENISDRVQALGGRVQVDSTRGRGTTVRAELPCAS